MIVLLLGYRSKKSRAIGEPLYIGPDAAAALDLQNDPPAGIVKTALFRNLRPQRTRFHSTPAKAEPEPKPKPKPKK